MIKRMRGRLPFLQKGAKNKQGYVYRSLALAICFNIPCIYFSPRSRSRRHSHRRYSRSRSHSHSHRRRSRSRSYTLEYRRRKSRSHSPMSNRRRHTGSRVCGLKRLMNLFCLRYVFSHSIISCFMRARPGFKK